MFFSTVKDDADSSESNIGCGWWGSIARIWEKYSNSCKLNVEVKEY